MGYRIFYSYQSDIQSKLNHKFIRDAINNAIANITDFDIEPLVEGFYNIGGNPPLAATMLEQSRESDIFIGDVTFTSSKIWQSDKIDCVEDDKSYTFEIAKPIDLKPAPNPNVLIETGYSWALKSYNRTILVMNEAFGKPNLLPVDMGDLRWPITYNLTEERNDIISKRNKEFKNLCKTLEEAIREAIKSNIEYQIKTWDPFKIGNRWKKYHSFPYKLTSSLESKIKELRDLLRVSNCLRITGAKGCGKTRFVLEALSYNEEADFESLTEQILYHDYEGATAGDVSKQISKLGSLNQHKIFIADNCSIEEHNKLKREFRNTNIKLISIRTVESTLNTDNANIFIEENITSEIFKEIVEEKFGIEKLSEIKELFNLNLDEFVERLLDGFHKNIQVSNIEYLELLLENNQTGKKAMKLLVALAFFKQIGVSGRYQNEVDFIRKTFVECDENELYKLKEFLESKRLIKLKGDFIILNRYESELKEYGIAQSIDNINGVVIGISNNNLWPRFKKTFFELLKKNPNLLEDLNSKQGILNDNKFLDSKQGGLLLNLLADEYPKLTLDILTKKIERNDRGI